MRRGGQRHERRAGARLAPSLPSWAASPVMMLYPGYHPVRLGLVRRLLAACS